MTWHEGALLGFDLETTGTDTAADLPVQIALVVSEPGRVVSREVFIVDPGREIPAGAEAIHGISTERARSEGRSLGDAAATVRDAIAAAERDGVPLVAMNASFDVTIAANLFERFSLAAPSWSAVIDPLVIDRKVDQYRKGNRKLDSLCAVYGVELLNAHDAGGDADATAALARAIAGRYPEIAAMEPVELTMLEAQWHKSWASGYDDWRRRQGREGLPPEDFCWPIRQLGAR